MAEELKRKRKSKIEVRHDTEVEQKLLGTSRYIPIKPRPPGYIPVQPHLEKKTPKKKHPPKEKPPPKEKKDPLNQYLVKMVPLPNTLQQSTSLQNEDMEPVIIDHTYARPNTTKSSSLKLSVKVEVEEIDESNINKNRTNVPVRTVPSVNLNSKENKQSSILIFEVNLEKMYQIADSISSNSTEAADKYLSIELKNVWGRLLKPKEEQDPYTEQIQKALLVWSQFVHHRAAVRESPLFYQCLICNLAWWYLAPFEEHIRTHDHNFIQVYHQDNGNESFIVLGYNISNKIYFIPCQGNCYRCGNSYSFHVKPPKKLYRCDNCCKTMETCTMVRLHELECSSIEQGFINKLSGEAPEVSTVTKNHHCQLCSARFETTEELDSHMVVSHDVRSDIPAPFSSKLCNMCNKKYHHYFTHMCEKSALCSRCSYCYRKFHTKTLQAMHSEIGNELDYECTVCTALLHAKCMMTEHMLTHTNKFRMVYKCIHIECPPTILFPDELSIRLHRVMYHYQKYDKRRTFYEKALIPTECVKMDCVQVIDKVQENRGIIIEKMSNPDELEDWCVPDVPGQQTNTRTNQQASKGNDVIIVNSQFQEADELVVVGGEGEGHQMDYAEMLSKVFKVDAVRAPRAPPPAPDKMLTQIKIEPTDSDFEDLIDAEEDPIILKQEPIEACLGSSFEDTCQADSYRNDTVQADSYQNDSSQADSFQNDTVQADSFQNDTCQADDQNNSSLNDDSQSSNSLIINSAEQSNNGSYTSDNIQCVAEFDTSHVQIKTEPQDYEIDCVFDSDITAVKMEPEDIKQEILECTELNEYIGRNIITPEEIFNTPETSTKSFKNNPKSLLKSNILEGETDKVICIKRKRQVKNSQCKSKKNLKDIQIEAEKTTNAKSYESDTSSGNFEVRHFKFKNNKIHEIVDIRDSNSLLKKYFIANASDVEEIDRNVKTKKRKSDHNIRMRTLKFDEHGNKLRKLYTCSICGYTGNHKLFRIHKESHCERSLHEINNEKYQCTKCDTCFDSLKTYLVHFRKHGYGVLHCPCCNIEFESLKDMMVHFHKQIKMSYVNCWLIKDASETTKRQHRCQVCRKIVDTEEFFEHWESHLNLQMETLRPEPLAAAGDQEAGTRTNTKLLPPATLHLALNQLRSPMRSKDKACRVCARRFSRRHDVKRHIIEHLMLDAYSKKDSSPTLKLKCQICAEEFVRAAQYKFHMREHGALPVYRCGLCDKTFSDSSNFAKHKKIHNMRVLICDICQKKFHAKCSLEKHIIMHMTTKPIQCDHCDRMFYEASHYKKHLHVRHTRTTKYRCKVCEASFDSLRYKWDHMWAVHRERKHKADCPVCNKGFRKYQDVKNHVKNAHKVDLSLYNIKSDSGGNDNVNLYCKINDKNVKECTIVAEKVQNTDEVDKSDNQQVE